MVLKAEEMSSFGGKEKAHAVTKRVCDMVQMSKAMKTQLDVHLLDTKPTPAQERISNTLDKTIANLKLFLKVKTVTVEIAKPVLMEAVKAIQECDNHLAEL
jgi:hypothetical protein